MFSVDTKLRESRFFTLMLSHCGFPCLWNNVMFNDRPELPVENWTKVIDRKWLLIVKSCDFNSKQYLSYDYQKGFGRLIQHELMTIGTELGKDRFMSVEIRELTDKERFTCQVPCSPF